MKKILTVSLFAVMAVSAAHAKIASVEYVDPKFQAINTTIGTWGTDQQAIGTDVADAVVNLNNNISAMTGTGEGSVAYQVKQEETRAMAAEAQALADAKAYADGLASNYDAAGSAAGALTEAQTYADQAEADAIASAKQYTDSLATNYDAAGSADDALIAAKAYTDAAAAATDGTLSSGFVKDYVDEKIGVLQGNTGGIQTELGQQQEEIDGLGQALEATATYDEDGNLTGGYVKDNADAIAAMDLTSQGAAGKFVSGVSQLNGQVSESLTDFAPEVVEDGKIAPTAGAVYTAVEGAKTYTDTAISNLTDSETMPAECKAQGARCALIAVGGELQWEPVEY